ncbi:MAG TPA: metal ABC transporter permease [Spirochaetia bacterium]
MLTLLSSDLFLRAFVGATLVAVVSAPVGYFLVLRAQAFAAEAFTDICFAGATGAALVGVSPLGGMVVFALFSAAGLGALGGRARGRGVEVGMVLSFALGLGVLFLSMGRRSSPNATAAVGILFGSLLSVQWTDIARMLVLEGVSLAALLVMFRPLLYATVDPGSARARGVPVRAVSVAFLVVLALAAASCTLVVGALLATALLIAPAAAAVRVTRGPGRAMLTAAGFGLLIAWGGLLVSFVGPWRHPPAGFAFSALAALVYGIALISGRRAKPRERRRYCDGEVEGDVPR